LAAALAGVALLPAAPRQVHAMRGGTIRIGAVFPLSGSMSPLARQEYRGIRIAQELVNAAGGIHGRAIVLDTRELDTPAQARSVMRSLHSARITTVLGAYSSALSVPASSAAAHNGMVYWEAGAVADRLTGRGLPTVFRVGASGANLGSNSARFAALQLAPRLSKKTNHMRISIVFAGDDYAASVAAAAMKESEARGMRIVSRTRYDEYMPDWSQVIARVKRAHPDVLILASHIPDGVSFRRAMLAAHLHVGAFVGSTMAQMRSRLRSHAGRRCHRSLRFRSPSRRI